MKNIEIGSLYFDRSPVSVGAKYGGEEISFGKAVPGKTISFIEWNGIYIADRCVCVGVSWEDLDKHGFIFGRPVRIDGTPYLCRPLKVGAEERVPNEWDAILDSLGEDNDLWHWENQFFWGQETPSEWPSFRAVRGYFSARNWSYYTASSRYAYLGFRPVLELLPPEPLVSDALIGQGIKVYSNNCSITGHLIGYNDYDLELTSAGSLPEVHPWIRQMKDTIFVDREAIVYLCEEE